MAFLFIHRVFLANQVPTELTEDLGYQEHKVQQVCLVSMDALAWM